jgi:hypothetical protein
MYSHIQQRLQGTIVPTIQGLSVSSVTFLSMGDDSLLMARLFDCLQVSEVEGVAESGSDQRHFAVVVHVLSDYAFKKYLQHCSQSELMLLRGMLLRVRNHLHQSAIDSLQSRVKHRPHGSFLAIVQQQ